MGVPRLIDFVDDAVLQRFFRAHEVVAFHILLHALYILTGHFGHHTGHFFLGLHQPFSPDGHVGGLTLCAAQGLMDHDLAVRQRQTLALLARHHQERAHAGGHADAHGAHVGLDIVHGVKDRHACGHAAARAVDVKRNIAVRVFHFQKQKLRDHQISGIIVNFPAQENNPVLQKAGVNIEGAFSPVGLFDHHRY